VLLTSNKASSLGSAKEVSQLYRSLKRLAYVLPRSYSQLQSRALSARANLNARITISELRKTEKTSLSYNVP